ncbi:putative cation-transporting ATPase [Phytophthora fragariae]|uniref:Putative cation-transporting ATPase n=1 Tax=Phytophthora fragariae TaxID=53985 RepID=A0A6G0R2V9_9STRA|nr:putative cation-transporting ATPase [Phytophthora fragariae]
MVRTSLLLLQAAALPALVAGTASQLDYPACAINHSPQYYCCDLGAPEGSDVSNGLVYVRYNKPQGEGFSRFYDEGWQKSRQINYDPDGDVSLYAPSTPSYVYGEAARTCRLHDVAVNGAVVRTLQCTFAPSSDDAIYTQNMSLAEDSTDTSVFWSSTPNPRNNNASLPIGGVCRSLMLDDGSVNATAKSLCTSQSGTSVYRFNSFTETPLVVVYAVYALCFVSLACWAAARTLLGVQRSSDAAAPLTSIDDGGKKLLDHRGGPETPGIKSSATRPSLADRPSEVQLRNSTEDIVQTGYTDSVAGYVVFGYFVLMTVLLNIPIILTIRDNQGKLATDTYAAWFNPTTVVIKVFISLWVIATVWFVVVVVYRFKILNFFRYPTALDKCTRVLMYKPEVTETMLADRSGVAQMVLKVESFLFPHSRQGVEETVTVHTTAEGARFLEFQHLRYSYDDVEGKFIPGSVVLPDTYDKILSDSQGLTTDEHARRQDVVGRNAIEVEMPSWATSVVDEFFSFFYIYQLMCYYVWYFTDYVWVSVLNTVVIVLAAAFNIYAKRSMLASAVQMTHYVADVTVKRDGEWSTIKSSDLAPGDLVRVTENWELPCDLVIVKGSTVCDESMLTGESMPVQKFPLPNDSSDVYDAEGNGKKYTLFSGTRTLASGRDEEILAIVQATGAHTSRGQLVQAILYPAPIRFKYDEHLKAVFSVLFVIGLIAAYFAMKFLIENAGLSNTLFAFVYGMFMFSAVLNPLLPVVMTIGQVNAAKRLQKQDVFCLNPQRITLCGKVRVFCFDKTGTITKEGLDYRGCLPIGESGEFLSEFNDMSDASLNQMMKFSLASCHAVGSLNGELVGNEVEVKMFKSTQWKLIEVEGQLPVVESADGSEELEFVKRFEFDHHRMSMSVVMKQKSTSKLIVFCKGSYEKMASVSSSDSIPANYFQTAENLAKNGCYVLGIAYKEMPAMSEAALAAFLADRDAVEESLALLGLIMFRNEIKGDSRDAILTLKQGNIRSVMITGDNAMTGCYIARASGMVEEDSQMVLGDMVADEKTGSMLVWKDVDTQEVFSFDDIRDMVDSVDTKVELAVTGKAFDFLVKMGDIHKILLKTRIFSRMTPQGKVDCVKLHMGTGSVTGMCGDGGNDCGALRIAHVGVALSDAEASVVSPFTSKARSLKAVVDLVLEGRGALATSFASVKYLIMYGLIGIGCRSVMYYNGVFISQFGFMYLDGAILVGISYGLTRARPLQSMGSQRPTSSLVGPTTVCSLVGAAVIHWLFLFGAIRDLTTQPWYCPFQPSEVNLVQWWLLQDSNLGSTLWFIICFQQMSTGLTMGLGSRFRRPIWHNVFLLFWYALLFVVLVVMFVGPPSRFSDQFRVASSTNVVGLPDIPLPKSFRWELFGWGIADTAAVLIFEYFFVLGYVRDFFRAKYHRDALPMKL